MSAEAPIGSASWRVDEFTVTLTLRRPAKGAAVVAVVEWSPKEPSSLTTDQLETYRIGRNRAVEDLSRALGLRTLVVDL